MPSFGTLFWIFLAPVTMILVISELVRLLRVLVLTHQPWPRFLALGIPAVPIVIACLTFLHATSVVGSDVWTLTGLHWTRETYPILQAQMAQFAASHASGMVLVVMLLVTFVVLLIIERTFLPRRDG